MTVSPPARDARRDVVLEDHLLDLVEPARRTSGSHRPATVAMRTNARLRLKAVSLCLALLRYIIIVSRGLYGGIREDIRQGASALKGLKAVPSAPRGGQADTSARSSRTRCGCGRRGRSAPPLARPCGRPCRSRRGRSPSPARAVRGFAVRAHGIFRAQEYYPGSRHNYFP
jgi:hypothetical protein